LVSKICLTIVVLCDDTFGECVGHFLIGELKLIFYKFFITQVESGEINLILKENQENHDGFEWKNFQK
jgi:hypothetical protein